MPPFSSGTFYEPSAKDTDLPEMIFGCLSTKSPITVGRRNWMCFKTSRRAQRHRRHSIQSSRQRRPMALSPCTICSLCPTASSTELITCRRRSSCLPQPSASLRSLRVSPTTWHYKPFPIKLSISQNPKGFCLDSQDT